MGLESALLLKSASDTFFSTPQPCCSSMKKVLTSRRCSDHSPRLGMLCKLAICGDFQNSSQFSSKPVQQGNVGLHYKKWNTDGSLRVHQRSSSLFRSSAMSTSRDSDDGEQFGTERETITAMSSTYPCMYLKRTVCAGEKIQYPGTVVVLGDVCEGGTIMADGDIVVLGRLQGDVISGQNRDRGAIVYASQLDVREIRIAGTASPVSNWKSNDGPAIVSLEEDGTLDIRPAVERFNNDEEASNLNNLDAIKELKNALRTSKSPGSLNQKASNLPAKMALFTGFYISVVGMLLLIFPTTLFGTVFDVGSVTVGWIRVGAILAVVFGVYYIGTAVGDMRGVPGARAFYISTVIGRIFLFLAFYWLVAINAAQPALLLVGVVNMIGAMSMLQALRKTSHVTVSKA